MVEKSFFRIRVKESCSYPAIMVKGLGKVTKTWQLKKGEASDYAEYPDLDVQPMVKEGNGFVPAPIETSLSGGNAESEACPPNFAEMTVEQLKAYLTAHGFFLSDLKGMAKADLIVQAETTRNSRPQEPPRN